MSQAPLLLFLFDCLPPLHTILPSSIINMSDSRAQVVATSAHASLPQAVSEPPTSSSLPQVEPFNSQARQAFQIMLESRKYLARERVTASEKQKYIKWLTDIIPDRLNVAESKKRAWVKNDFTYERGKLWKLPGRVYKQPREVISEDIICDTIIRVHLNLSHAGQRATGVKVKNEYYGAADSEVTFLVKLCGVCHRRRKGPISDEDDDAYALMQGSNRKRIAYQQPEALHTTPKSTKYENMSGNSGLIVINHEDSVAPSASVLRERTRRSPVIKVENTFSSQSNTQTSRPPDNGARDLEISEDGDNDQPLSSLNLDLLRAAPRTPYQHAPIFDASNHDHNQVTNQPTTQDNGVVEEQDPPSLPHPIASSTAPKAQSRNAPNPQVQIQYFIITARTPRLAYTLWPEGTLRDKTIGQIFDEVTTHASHKRAPRKIVFKLCTSQVEMEYPICRGDGNAFGDMRRAFNEGLKADRKKGITRFEIWLEPDPERRGLIDAELAEVSENEEDLI